jgi:alpha-1,3-rhamnosyl/mannosyltransferase
MATGAYYVNPEDTDSIARGIERVLHDRPLRETLVAAGKARAQAFSWQTAATQHQAVYETVVRE